MGNSAVPGLRGASDDDPLIELDDRGRVSLGRYTDHRRFLVTAQDGGQLLLTPVTVIAAGQEPPGLEANQRGARRGRPIRKPEGEQG